MEVIKKFELKSQESTEDSLKIKAVVSSTGVDSDKDKIDSKESYVIPSVVNMYIDHKHNDLNSLVGVFNNYYFEKKDNVDLLVMEGEVFKTELTKQHIIPLIEKGVINKFSIGFKAKKYNKMNTGGYLFKEIEIKEVSLVGIPSNNDTELLEVKHLQQEEVIVEQKEDINLVLEKKLTEFDSKLKEHQDLTQKNIMNLMTNFNKEEKKESQEELFLKALTSGKKEDLMNYKTLNSFDNPTGGYLIPTAMSDELFRNVFVEDGNIISLADSRVVADKMTSYAVQLTSPKAKWELEGAPTTLTSATFKPMTIDIRRLSCGTDATWEGLNYQSVYTKNQIISDLKEAIRTRLCYDMLYGDVSTGGLGGIITSTTKNGGVGLVQTKTTGVVDFTDFNTMFGKCKLVFANLDTIVMHRETFYYLMNQKSTTGEPIYKVFEDYQSGALVRRFMNKNVVLVGDYIDYNNNIVNMLDKPDASGNLASGSKIAIYGDFKGAYRALVKKNMFLTESDKDFPSSLVSQWYAHIFVGGNVIQPEALKVLVIK